MAILNKLVTIMRTISKFTAMSAVLGMLIVIVGAVVARWVGKPIYRTNVNCRTAYDYT